MNASHVVDCLLGDRNALYGFFCEASVYLPPRSTKWVAVFTGVEPGRQVRRSTGLTNREAALVLAGKWEREEKMQRALSSSQLKKPSVRVGSKEAPGILSQKQVAAVLGMSERGVREAERRAFSKLRNHPDLREFWKHY